MDTFESCSKEEMIETDNMVDSSQEQWKQRVAGSHKKNKFSNVN